MTLKTLKDLEWKSELGQIEINGMSPVCAKQLRQEAIEWIKWFDRNSDVLKIYENETKPSDMALFAVLNKEDLIKIGKKEALEMSHTRIAIADWIKKFFGIHELEKIMKGKIPIKKE